MKLRIKLGGWKWVAELHDINGVYWQEVKEVITNKGVVIEWTNTKKSE